MYEQSLSLQPQEHYKAAEWAPTLLVTLIVI